MRGHSVPLGCQAKITELNTQSAMTLGPPGWQAKLTEVKAISARTPGTQRLAGKGSRLLKRARPRLNLAVLAFALYQDLPVTPLGLIGEIGSKQSFFDIF